MKPGLRKSRTAQDGTFAPLTAPPAMKIPLSLMVFAISTGLSQGALIQFDLRGNGGAGLLSSNQNGIITGTPGSGGEIGAGIIYDDVTKMLTINVGWGV